MSELKKTNLNILFLTAWYPNEDNPISGIFIKRHAEAVSKFCNVNLLYIHQSQFREASCIEYSVENGIKTYRVYLRRPISNHNLFRVFNYLFYNTLFGDFYLLIHCFKPIKKIFKKEAYPDLIHLNVIRPLGLTALFLKFSYKIPFVLTEHSSPFIVHIRSNLQKVISKKILSEAELIMPVSEFLKNEITQFFKEFKKFFVIPNVVNTSFFMPDPKIDKHKNQFIHVSNHNDEQKNISGILKAVYLLLNDRCDFKLKIIGNGKDTEYLKKLAKELNLADNVEFLGKVTENELLDNLNKSDFFVLNSNHESFAVVCIEALSTGIPILSTKCGGPEEYIFDKTGLLVNKNNVHELILGINFMLDNNWKYNPTELHEYAVKKFGYLAVGQQIFTNYLECLS